jgi:4-alpha-glucanotransferase
MPISALPGAYGIGAFSKEAYEFVDFLKAAGQSLWQILPLGPTGYGDSPYQSFSTFAGNPYFIDLTDLIAQGLLTNAQCAKARNSSNDGYVDYEQIYKERFKLLKIAYRKAKENGLLDDASYRAFYDQNEYWLADYSLFTALKKHFKQKSFLTWKKDIRTRTPAAMAHYHALLAEECECTCFIQYEFYKQWTALKHYAGEQGIRIIGDIPIYVALDSADVWANPELFQLDEKLIPTRVAGCPPDAFSETGQLWGNPLYNWAKHQETNFAWWIQRVKHCYNLYDVLRIDHFRGFESYWSIPYADETAEYGRWEKGPGYAIFQALKQSLGDIDIIAEDLGFLTDRVRRLLKRCGYPGMKVLQFAFDSGPKNVYLLHNHVQNCVVYTGTHDNDSLLGWFTTLSPKTRKFMKNYLGIQSNKDIVWKLIQAAFRSVADTVIIPMQDYLELGSESRMNTPATLGNNWKWRANQGDFRADVAQRIYRMTALYERLTIGRTYGNRT